MPVKLLIFFSVWPHMCEAFHMWMRSIDKYKVGGVKLPEMGSPQWCWQGSRLLRCTNYCSVLSRIWMLPRDLKLTREHWTQQAIAVSHIKTHVPRTTNINVSHMCSCYIWKIPFTVFDVSVFFDMFQVTCSNLRCNCAIPSYCCRNIVLKARVIFLLYRCSWPSVAHV